MTIDGAALQGAEDLGIAGPDGPQARDAQGDEGPESTAVDGIVGAAMVGLLGGGPRLAIRAARVVLADSYGSRSRAGGRLRGRIRSRGE